MKTNNRPMVKETFLVISTDLMQPFILEKINMKKYIIRYNKKLSDGRWNNFTEKLFTKQEFIARWKQLDADVDNVNKIRTRVIERK